MLFTLMLYTFILTSSTYVADSINAANTVIAVAVFG
jgi:hypothetical protein